MISNSLTKFFFSSGKIGKIGFIGLGNMGRGMVLNLKQKTDYNIVAFDVNEAARKDIETQGIQTVSSVLDIANDKDITQVITMVPNLKIVSDLCLGENGLFAKLPKNSTVIDCSTIGPIGAKELFEQAQKQGQHFIDAPVSGGINGANLGSLTFMVGASSEQQFEVIQKILQPMGKNIFNCKKPSGGQIVKACNNMALGIQMASITEALNLGEKLGMDPKLLSEIINTATAACWCSLVQNPIPGFIDSNPASKNYDIGFQTDLLVKDMKLAIEGAKSVNADVFIGEQSLERFVEVQKAGFGKKDFSYMYQVLKNKN